MKKQLAARPSCRNTSHYILRYGLIGLIVSAILYLAVQYPAGAKSRAGEHLSPNMPQASATPNPGRIVYVSRPGYTGLSMINTDSTNPVSLTDFTDNSVDQPSVSSQTGMVAFQASAINVTPPVDRGDWRIFVMNGDGSGIRQITFAPNPGEFAQYTADINPRISPDGTRVAFISKRKQGTPLHACNNRFIYGSITEQQEVFVVNTDGTNLQQVTQPDYIDTSVSDNDSWGVCAATNNYQVAWTPDNQLVILGIRRYSYSKGGPSGGQAMIPAIVTPAGTLYYPNVGQDTGNDSLLDSDPQKIPTAIIGGDLRFCTFDVSSDGTVLFAADIVDPFHANYENQNSIALWKPGTKSAHYILTQSLMGQVGYGGATDGQPHGGYIYNARFSPDGSHFLILGRSPLTSDFYDHLFIDGGGGMISNTGPVQGGWGIAWAAGPAIPKPDKLVLTPNPLLTFKNTQQAVQLTPSLLDAGGHVIVRTALFHGTDGAGFRCDNTPDQIPCSNYQLRDGNIDFTGKVTGADIEMQGNLCAVNGGLRSCVPYYNTSGEAFLSVAATKPVALTSGTGGAGVLTIKREGDTPSLNTLVVNFTLGGTAQRDVDYSLDFSGNTIVLPANQNSVDINVRPLRHQSEDKTVTLTLQPDPQVNYAIASFSSSMATVTIKDDGVSNNLSLSAITPGAGGDEGAVTATVYGTNIQTGATVKLSRSGQTDIAGTAASTAANGFSITATFDLTGRAQGQWDVVVTNPNNQTATLPAAFNIEASKGAQLWVDVVGRFTMRSGLTERFYIAYGNRGDVDAQPTMIRIYIPAGLYTQGLPTLPDGSVPAYFPEEDGSTVLEFYLKGIAAGSASYLPLNLTADPELAHKDVKIRAFAMSSPGLKEVTDVQPDPTASYTVELAENSDRHSKTTIHFTSASGSFDIVDEVTIGDDTQARPRALQVVEDGDTIQYIYTMSVPKPPSQTSQALNAHATRLMPQEVDKYGHLVVKEIISVPASVEITTSSSYGPKLYKLPSTIQTTEFKVHRRLFVKCLVKQGLLGNYNSETPPTEDTFDQWYQKVGIPSTVVLTTVRTIERSVYPFGSNVITLERKIDPGFEQWLSTKDFPDNRLGAMLFYEIFGKPVDPSFFALTNPNITPEMWELYQKGSSDPTTKLELLELLIRRCAGCSATNQGSQSHAGAKGRMMALIEAMTPQCGCSSGLCQFTTKEILLKILFSHDPNEKVGTEGSGERHYITGADPSSYSIFFENKADATAPAQRVVITDQLDTSKLDIKTLSLGAFSFGDTVVAVPPGLSDYTTDVDLRPAKNLIVRINAQLDKTTGLLTAQFTSLDPSTMQPTTDPLAGFLPPNVTSPEGEGSIIFSVQPKSGLATGDEIRNHARIVFDRNEPIDTAEWLNTIDRTKPQSQVAPLPATECGGVEVSWSGTDAGAGIESYSIYVSEDGGPYVIWQVDTTDTHATFTGQAGKSYSFYSVARDGAGNTEGAPASADAMTTITPASITVTAPPYKTFNTGASATSCGLLIDSAALGTASASGGCSTLTMSLSGIPAGNVFPIGTTTITYTAMDANGNTGTAEQQITVVDKTPPVISAVSVDKTVLWPADHKMVDVTLLYNVTDNCDESSGITRVLSVTSNEPINGTGDGDTAPDWEVLDANHVRLRAERAGNGQGRAYTITITAKDSKGNYSSRSVVVKVPKSK